MQVGWEQDTQNLEYSRIPIKTYFWHKFHLRISSWSYPNSNSLIYINHKTRHWSKTLQGMYAWTKWFHFIIKKTHQNFWRQVKHTGICLQLWSSWGFSFSGINQWSGWIIPCIGPILLSIQDILLIIVYLSWENLRSISPSFSPRLFISLIRTNMWNYDNSKYLTF